MIEKQVKLKLSIALGVVRQGIRIRFGRSLVTIMGVALGIAFLMSILAGQVIKEEVGQEDRLRTETKRMYSFLAGEMGPPYERTIGVIQIGPLSEVERRLLLVLEDNGLQGANWAMAISPIEGQAAGAMARAEAGEKFEFAFKDAVKRKEAALANVTDGASALLVMGRGALKEEMLAGQFVNARQKVLALSRKEFAVGPVAGVSVVALERELKPEEIAKIEKDAQKSRFRSRWIIVISLAVTVIGISNAMLMSVTERFREIGTMKCLGALSSFIRALFLIESSLMGCIGGLAGGVFGAVFSIALYGATYGYGLVFSSLNVATLGLCFLLCLAAGIVLSIIAAIYPASVASRMVPATALRTNI